MIQLDGFENIAVAIYLQALYNQGCEDLGLSDTRVNREAFLSSLTKILLEDLMMSRVDNEVEGGGPAAGLGGLNQGSLGGFGGGASEADGQSLMDALGLEDAPASEGGKPDLGDHPLVDEKEVGEAGDEEEGEVLVDATDDEDIDLDLDNLTPPVDGKAN